MVAKKLASVIGVDYALMSGGDVSPLGADAVTQIHNLFSWAKMSPRGVILFIDEAECFLGSRESGLMSETAHNALNALLYNTGGERKVSTGYRSRHILHLHWIHPTHILLSLRTLCSLLRQIGEYSQASWTPMLSFSSN